MSEIWIVYIKNDSRSRKSIEEKDIYWETTS
jgi:hypothetical protein